jgi:lipoprotein-anchoring transpeptidase ErfK/SrfK
MSRHVVVLVLVLGAVVPATQAQAQAPEPPNSVSVRAELPTAVAVVGDRFAISGSAAGAQGVQVRARRGGRTLLKRTVTPGPDGAYRLGLAIPGAGRVELRVVPLDAQGAAAAPVAMTTLEVLPRSIGPGSSPSRVAQLQDRLRALAYVVGRHGRYDARTARAVLAFRKVTGMTRTSRADVAVMRRLARGEGRFRVRFPQHGRHLEADISGQVLALIGAGGKVERIYPTSTGARATPTIRGSYRVYRKEPGTNALGMVHSVYFIRGFAVHGFASVPTYPASHGCLRVPVPDARTIFRWLRVGTRVDTYL